MGCWNGTCGVTQLSINHGDPVAYFLLAKVDNGERNDGGFCHSGGIWGPIALPIYAEYNDYGSIEEFESTQPLDHIVQLLHRFGVKVEPKNEYRTGFDPARMTTDDACVFDLIEEALHEGVLRIRDICGFDGTRGEAKETGLPPSFRVGLMMIHREIYEGLCQSYSHWLTEKPVPFDAVLSHANKAYDKLVQKLKHDTFISDRFGSTMTLRLLWETTERDESMFTSFFQSHESDVYTSQYMEKYAEQLVEHAKNGDEDPPLIAEICRFQIFRANMASLRKFWSPQTGAGSQHNNEDNHAQLIAMTQHLIDKKRQRWADENLTDEEMDALEDEC